MKKNNKLMNCTHCGVEIAKSAKACPHCGAKNKKPIYKRGWFIVLTIFIVISAIGSMGGNPDTKKSDNTVEPTIGNNTSVSESESVIEYTNYQVSELMDDLSENALKAEKKYADTYVAVTGRLNVIDSSGKYISIVPTNKEFAITGVQCYIKKDEQLDKVMEMKIGDTITLKGKITDVGEIIGYSLDIDTIE